MTSRFQGARRRSAVLEVGPCVDPSGCQEWQLKAAIEAMSPARRDYQFEARDGKKWAPFENPRYGSAESARQALRLMRKYTSHKLRAVPIGKR